MLKFIKPEEGYMDGIINSIADPIFVKDKNHRWVYFNDAFCKMIGRSRGELIGKTDYDFFPTEESDVFWEKDEFVFRENAENINEEKVTDANGKTHTIVTKKVLYMDPSGNHYIVGVIRDITEHKKHEDDLKARIKNLEEEVAKIKAGNA